MEDIGFRHRTITWRLEIPSTLASRAIEIFVGTEKGERRDVYPFLPAPETPNEMSVNPG